MAQLPRVGPGPWDPHVGGGGAGTPWGGVFLVKLQGDGFDDLMAGPIPFFFHESCF